MANLWEINTTEWMYTKSELDILFSAVEPKKWTDDNYVTDAEKIKLANLEWVNNWNETHTTIWTLYKSASAQTTIDDLNLFWVVGDVLWATLNKITWANIKAALKTYFDTIYQTILVNWVSIKTVNWTNLLWSWNIVISGWSWATKRILTVWWTIWTTWINVWPNLTIDWTYTISQVNLSYWTAWNWTLTVDINKNGTTLFATTKPSITWTNKYSINTWTLTDTSLVAWDSITIDIDAVPWTPWTDLYVEIIYS